MGSGQDKSVLILGVIYNSWKDTVRFVDSITRCFDREANLILVDNSENLSRSLLSWILFRSMILLPTSNQGRISDIFRVPGQGLMYYLKANPVIPKWIIVCNVDIIFDTLAVNE
jgi:hypothetical protein